MADVDSHRQRYWRSNEMKCGLAPVSVQSHTPCKRSASEELEITSTIHDDAGGVLVAESSTKCDPSTCTSEHNSRAANSALDGGPAPTPSEDMDGSSSARCTKPLRKRRPHGTAHPTVGRRQAHVGATSDWACPWPGCEISYTREAGLKRHMAVHTGEKNWQCEVCGKTMKYKYNMKTHMYIHEGVFPFLCRAQGCLMRFKDGSRRRLHECMEHSEEAASLAFLK